MESDRPSAPVRNIDPARRRIPVLNAPPFSKKQIPIISNIAGGIDIRQVGFAKPLYGLTPVPRVRPSLSARCLNSRTHKYLPHIVSFTSYIKRCFCTPDRCISGAYSRDRSNCCIAAETSESAVLM
jgi:hypothetical protein